MRAYLCRLLRARYTVEAVADVMMPELDGLTLPMQDFPGDRLTPLADDRPSLSCSPAQSGRRCTIGACGNIVGHGPVGEADALHP
jgi:hypothetical protein